VESAHSVLLQVISICYGCFFLGQYIAAIKVKPNSDGKGFLLLRIKSKHHATIAKIYLHSMDIIAKIVTQWVY